MGPVALYPDDLLAIVLPASTYPLEVVQAARFLEELAIDGSLEPDEEWDESITALLNYPEVLQLMDEDIDWTWRLGEAVIAQQEDLISAIESFRDRAYAAGNLKTDDYQSVNNEDGVIEIVPVDHEVIYVPYYEPEDVIVNQPRTVYYYYPRAYPVYYYPYPAGHRFVNGYFWGVTTAFAIGWRNDYLHVYHPSYWGHPYYGHHYYGSYYRRPSLTVFNTWYVNNSYRHARFRYRDGDYWRPRHRSGARQYEPRVRNTYYAPQSGDRSRMHARRDIVRSRNAQGIELGLRERNSTGARSIDSTAAHRRATSSRQDDNRRRTEQRRSARGHNERRVRDDTAQQVNAGQRTSERRSTNRPEQTRRSPVGNSRSDQATRPSIPQIRVARDRADRTTPLAERRRPAGARSSASTSERRTPRPEASSRPTTQNRATVQRQNRPSQSSHRTSTSETRRPAASRNNSQRPSKRPAASNNQRQTDSGNRAERRKRR